MGKWETNLYKKLGRNSIQCSQENSPDRIISEQLITQKPVKVKSTTTKLTAKTTQPTTTRKPTTRKTTTRKTTTRKTTTPKPTTRKAITQVPTTLATTTKKKVEASFCGDKDDGHYSHDKSCSRFYQCHQGRIWDMPCPGGLHFNPKIEVCDWPANAGCTLE